MDIAQIAAMEAGLEVDRAVAKAIGWPMVNGDPDDYWNVHGDDVQFRPSLDWNDAMMAAGKIGLFDYSNAGRGLSLNKATEWRVYSPDAEAEWRSHEATIATAPTGPLAICRAILSSCTDT